MQKPDDRKPDNQLSVKIRTTQGTWSTDFPTTTKVEDVIKATMQHFGFAPNGQYELRLEREPNTPVKPERTLVSYGMKDGDVLIFTDLGIAV